MTSNENVAYKGDESLIERYQSVRQKSIDICRPLEVEDMVVQPIAFVSPPKWHLAHTTWFFVNFLLHRFGITYAWPEEYYPHLFNSYYKSQGKHWEQGSRGDLSRPTVNQILKFREDVDYEMITWLTSYHGDLPKEVKRILRLGLEHEQQHQELMLTDLKYNLSFNPLYPIYAKAKFPEGHDPNSEQTDCIMPLEFIEFGGGIYNFGKKGSGFSFDNETPRHQALINDFRLANRLITNAEYCEFIDNGGYQDSSLWLADGWSWVQNNNITAPLYWHLESDDGQPSQRYEFRLTGYGQLHPQQPVTHVSFYEADAFARWAGKRLPTEYEWEVASKKRDIKGTFVESLSFHPLMINPASKHYPKDGMKQLFGDCWQWTQSSYAPYPQFKTPEGAVGEYNAKFMCNQMVLRGGSCVSPRDHLRTTYRNFFYPQDRWQFTGIRLAEDA